MLGMGTMFKSNLTPQRDEDGYVFLDNNGDMFGYILDFLRNDAFDLPDDFTKVNALKSEHIRNEVWFRPSIITLFITSYQ